MSTLLTEELLNVSTQGHTMKLSRLAFLIPTTLLLGSTSTPAATITVEAGRTHTLENDLTLNGSDDLFIQGTPAKLCVLVGNRHRIVPGISGPGH